MATAGKGGGKNRKYGRNKKDATRYQLENRLVKNKVKSLAKHLKKCAKKHKKIIEKSIKRGFTRDVRRLMSGIQWENKNG